MIPFIDLKSQQARLRADIDGRIAAVLDHGGYIMGQEVRELEDELKSWSDAQEVISCSSGTDALLLALMGLGLRPGQGVIVPSFTFTASAEVMPMLGAIPIFAEVEEDSFNLDANRLDDALKAGQEQGITVVGIIAVGLFGQPSDMPAIQNFAKANGLWVIDDAAQSFGTRIGNQKTGNMADITCTSFFPAKPLGCYGDGGALFTNNQAAAEIIRSARIHGQGKDKYHNERIGMTARLDTMQAAILQSKLTIFEDELNARQKVADTYAKLISQKCGSSIIAPVLKPGRTSSWAQYVIRLPKGCDRSAVQAYLSEKSVPTAIYYPMPMHHQKPYSRYPVAKNGLAVTETLCTDVLALPMHPYLDEKTADQIITHLAAAISST